MLRPALAAAAGGGGLRLVHRPARPGGGPPASDPRLLPWASLPAERSAGPRAIEVFIKVLEIDEETAETQLALGNLYRRRGEVDRAIRLHQNLVARPALTDDLRLEAHLELAQDYLSAGVLDRAEDIYRDLVRTKAHRVQALRHLLDIYEQEKDWERARSTAMELAAATGTEQGAVISQYLCEGAEQAKKLGNCDEALALLRSAREAHPTCARASLTEGGILQSRGSFDLALAAYRRIEDQDVDYLPEVIERIQEGFDHLGRREAARDYLERVRERYGGMTVMLALANMIRDERGNTSAIQFMLEALAKRPTVRGFDRLLDFASKSDSSDVPDHLEVMKGLLGQFDERSPRLPVPALRIRGPLPALAVSGLQTLEHRPPRSRSGRRVGEIRCP